MLETRGRTGEITASPESASPFQLALCRFGRSGKVRHDLLPDGNCGISTRTLEPRSHEKQRRRNTWLRRRGLDELTRRTSTVATREREKRRANGRCSIGAQA